MAPEISGPESKLLNLKAYLRDGSLALQSSCPVQVTIRLATEESLSYRIIYSGISYGTLNC